VRYLRKLLVAGGLVLVTGPFCFLAAAQEGYVDLEAEAAAREAAGKGAPEDPYGARPTRAYPATSYGLDRDPAPPPVTGAAPASREGGRDTAGSGGLSNLFLQVQRLQEEVRRLTGQVEEQAHELRQLREQSLQRYMDLDKRLSAGGAASGDTSGGTVTPPPDPRTEGSDARGEQPGEKIAYDAAYALVANRRFEEAVPAFNQFLRDYPQGRYAPNAHYWLGELYLVTEPPDLEASRQAFALLISEYPEHDKTADALYKLGRVQFMKGNREKAREYLDLVVNQYASSDPAVVKLARDFIAQNY